MHGAADSRATNAYIGAGAATPTRCPAFARGSRPSAPTDQSQATERYKFDNTPVQAIAPEGPQFVTNATAPGKVPPLVSEGNIEGGFIAQNWGSLGDLPMLRASSDVGPKKRNQWLLRYLSTICLSSRDLLAPLAARIPPSADGSILRLTWGY